MRTKKSMLRHTLPAALVAASVCVTAGAAADQVVVTGGDSPASGPNPYLFTSGLTTLGLSYTPALVTAVISPRDADRFLYAPVVGPWLDLAARDCSGCDHEKVNKALLVVDGVFQAIGTLQVLGSLMFIDSGTAQAPSDSLQATIAPARFADGHYGMVAAGPF